MADPRQPSWPELIDAIVTSRLRTVHVALPGTIKSYDSAAFTATVEVAVHLESTEGAFDAAPPLEGVPVAWPGAWADGDSCLLVFCEESFAKWFATGSIEPPDVLRRHGLHAICIPLVAREGDTVQFVALANLVDARLTAMQAAFDSHTHLYIPPLVPAVVTPIVTAPPVPLVGPLAPTAADKVQAR